ELQRERASEVAAIAGGLELAQEGPVDETAGLRGGVGDRPDEAAHERAHRDLAPRVGVEARELARREKSAEGVVPAEEEAAGHGDRVVRRGLVVARVADDRARGAEAGER